MYIYISCDVFAVSFILPPNRPWMILRLVHPQPAPKHNTQQAEKQGHVAERIVVPWQRNAEF